MTPKCSFRFASGFRCDNPTAFSMVRVPTAEGMRKVRDYHKKCRVHLLCKKEKGDKP